MCQWISWFSFHDLWKFRNWHNSIFLSIPNFGTWKSINLISKSTGFVCHHALFPWKFAFWDWKLTVSELAKNDDFHVLPQQMLWERRDAKTSASDSETSFNVAAPNYTPSKTAHSPFRCFHYCGCCLLNVFENQYHISTLEYQTTIFMASCEQKVFLQSLPSDLPPLSPLFCALAENVGPAYFCARYTVTGDTCRY